MSALGRRARWVPRSRYLPSLGILLLVYAAVGATAATRSIVLDDDRALMGRTTLLLANLGLLMIAVMQAIVQWRRVRRKYKVSDSHRPIDIPVVRQPGSPLRGELASVPASTIPAECAGCHRILQLPANAAGRPFRCGSCRTLGLIS